MTALSERERRRERREDLRAGQICAQIVNYAGKVAKQTVRATDFFVERQDDAEAVRAALLAWGRSTKGVTVQ